MRTLVAAHVELCTAWATSGMQRQCLGSYKVVSTRQRLRNGEGLLAAVRVEHLLWEDRKISITPTNSNPAT